MKCFWFSLVMVLMLGVGVTSAAPDAWQKTIAPGEQGFYAITDSSIRTAANQNGQLSLHVSVQRAGDPDQSQRTSLVNTVLGADQAYEFDVFLGYLGVGDQVNVVAMNTSSNIAPPTEFSYKVTRQTAIPVSVLHEDVSPAKAYPFAGDWRIKELQDAGKPGTPVAQSHHCEILDDSVRITMPSGKAMIPRDLVYTVPQSGTYALHDTHIKLDKGHQAEIKLFVGKSIQPKRTLRITDEASLDLDLGYLAKGEQVRFAFGTVDRLVQIKMTAAISQWAVRRAPLRAHRFEDGLLDIYEPQSPRHAIDIPEEHWFTVGAVPGDATEQIRTAIKQAISKRQSDDYVGIRLVRGQTYTVASEQIGGRLFEIQNTSRFVFDGNGATLKINSPEIQRDDIDLFTVDASNKVMLADLKVVCDKLPYATGMITGLDPLHGNTQTVTFDLVPGSPDPLKEIARKGNANGYAYDPTTPGQLAYGAWSFYPGAVKPNLVATDKPGQFKHTVTRTMDSLKIGDRWLIKNKRAGVLYLVTRGGSEDVTLWQFDCKASGGGLLRNWATDAINILDTSIRPHDGRWISTTSDGIHGRGREGVWVENLFIEGICEDIMNTYARTMAVKADDQPDDNVISLFLNERDPKIRNKRQLRKLSTGDSPHVGDKLMFFNPKTGNVIGYAMVTAVDGSRYTLSNPVPGIDAWESDSEPAATMVYNMRAAARFVVKDSNFESSMRYAIYIKAPHSMIFGNTFQKLASPPIYAANEPGWPEGPAPSHLWIQGNTFVDNNFSYMSRHRAFLNVDPACISIYTRSFTQKDKDGFNAYITHDQYANSNVKIIGNHFIDWRGMCIAVRNARNLHITDNTFHNMIVEDAALRRTLANDPAMSENGKGVYAAIFLDSVNGAVIKNNHVTSLPDGVVLMRQGQDVKHVDTDIK